VYVAINLASQIVAPISLISIALVIAILSGARTPANEHFDFFALSLTVQSHQSRGAEAEIHGTPPTCRGSEVAGIHGRRQNIRGNPGEGAKSGSGKRSG
jgi:hypothetical protein